MAEEFHIFTDGGFVPETELGAWAYWILKDGQTWKQGSGSGRSYSPLYSELEAVVRAIGELSPHTKIQVYTDSMEVAEIGVRVVGSTGLVDWIAKDSRRKVYEDLIWSLRELLRKRAAEWYWVRGHSGNEYNEWCDARCRIEMKKPSRSASRKPQLQPIRVQDGVARCKHFAELLPNEELNLPEIERMRHAVAGKLAELSGKPESNANALHSIRCLFANRYPPTRRERNSKAAMLARERTIRKALRLAKRYRGID